MENKDDYVIVWEAPIITPPELRLYYDDKGNVLFYTAEKVEGKYIVIDNQTFAEARPDLRIIDGQISRVTPNAVVYKLMPDQDEGIDCHPEDVSVIVDKDSVKQKWKLNIYEL
jgi:hypothetical protein